jgi:hypothetical protein
LQQALADLSRQRQQKNSGPAGLQSGRQTGLHFLSQTQLPMAQKKRRWEKKIINERKHNAKENKRIKKLDKVSVLSQL